MLFIYFLMAMEGSQKNSFPFLSPQKKYKDFEKDFFLTLIFL